MKMSSFYSQHRVNLTHDETRSLSDYQGPTSMFVNGVLRKNLEKGYRSVISQFKTKETIDNLDTALEKSTLKEDVLLYRGGNYAGLDMGDVFTDNAYWSTSTSVSAALKFIDPTKGEGMVVVRMPKGSNAIVVNAILPGNEYEFEEEVLLPRGSHFKVVKIYTQYKGKKSFHVFEVEPLFLYNSGMKLPTKEQIQKRKFTTRKGDIVIVKKEKKK